MDAKKQAEKIIGISTYIASSIATIVSNKYVLSVLNIKMHFMFLAFQSMVIVLIIVFCRILNILHFQRVCMRSLLYWLPLSSCLILMIYTGTRSIEYLPISIFALLKNGSIVLNAVVEKHIFDKHVPVETWASFGLMFISSYIGEAADFTSAYLGYAWMTLNIVSTSLYVIMMKMHADEEKTKTDPVFYCNLLSLPQLFLCSFLLDNLSLELVSVNWKLGAVVIASGLAAFSTSYSTVWCLKLLSSTTLSMLGALNKLLISISGILFIGEENVGSMKIISLVLGSLAGLLYSKSIKSE